MITAEQNVQAMREMREANANYRRMALVNYYRDVALTARAALAEAELMGRTVQYLDDAGVELEWRNKVKRD